MRIVTYKTLHKLELNGTVHSFAQKKSTKNLILVQTLERILPNVHAYEYLVLHSEHHAIKVLKM